MSTLSRENVTLWNSPFKIKSSARGMLLCPAAQFNAAIEYRDPI